MSAVDSAHLVFNFMASKAGFIDRDGLNAIMTVGYRDWLAGMGKFGGAKTEQWWDDQLPRFGCDPRIGMDLKGFLILFKGQAQFVKVSTTEALANLKKAFVLEEEEKEEEKEKVPYSSMTKMPQKEKEKVPYSSMTKMPQKEKEKVPYSSMTKMPHPTKKSALDVLDEKEGPMTKMPHPTKKSALDVLDEKEGPIKSSHAALIPINRSSKKTAASIGISAGSWDVKPPPPSLAEQVSDLAIKLAGAEKRIDMLTKEKASLVQQTNMLATRLYEVEEKVYLMEHGPLEEGQLMFDM